MTNERIPAQHQLIAVAVIALVTIGVYYGSLSGDFVYDDNRQIAQNPLIQERSLYGTAVPSDAWAVKARGEGKAPNSGGCSLRNGDRCRRLGVQEQR